MKPLHFVVRKYTAAVSYTHLTIINLDTSIGAMKENVQVSLDRVLRGLFITKADLDREASRYSRRISRCV